MRIAVDISPLESGHKVRGVGFYVKYLKEALEKYDDLHEYQFVTNLNQVKNPDILHIPYFDPFFRHLPLFKKVPTVITIHDLTPIKFPSHFPSGMKGNAIWQINKRIASSMNGIITDSQSSTNDVVDIIKIAKDKVHTVYLAPGDEFSKADSKLPNVRTKFHLPKEFVLYVGDVTWNKNVPRIVQAAIKADVPIVFAGKAIANKDYDSSNPWNRDLVQAQDLIRGYDKTQVLGFVTDNELRALYKAATALLLPSLYEGFGLPVVEAMASGCPVISSEEGSLSEVGGKAVYYVDPYSVDSIADGINDIFESKSLQVQLKKSGKIQVEKFTWKKTALDTIDVYQKVLMRK